MVPENKQNRRYKKLTLLAFTIIAILHNTLLATFITLLETVGKYLFRNRSQNRCHTFWIAATSAKRAPFCSSAFQAEEPKEVHPPNSPDPTPARRADNHTTFMCRLS
jgi:hypothetical protein